MKIKRIGNFNPNYDKSRKVISVKGLCDCLCASMGLGGGYVPLIIVKYENRENRKPNRMPKR